MNAISTTVDFTMPTYRRWPVEIVSGSGCRVTDSTGRTYLDFMSGIAVASVGHAHPRVAAAITAQAHRLIHVSNLYRTRPQTELSERLADLTGGMASFFTNSGAEAIECALKLARKWSSVTAGSRATRVIAADGGFHGRTFGALAATGQPAKQAPFAPMLPGFTHVPYGDEAALAEVMGDDVAAVLLEPIQGEAGVIVPPPGYLTAARELCTRWGALLVLDEIQTGLGRTGTWFAYEQEGVAPDIVCLAKALGGGLPIGACLAVPSVAETFAFGDHGSTFGGGPVQSAAACAVIDVIQAEGLIDRAASAGAELMRRLEALVGSAGSVRGRGLLIGVELAVADARRAAEKALEAGLLINDATPSVVRIAPPLVITDAEIDEGLHLIEEVFREI